MGINHEILRSLRFLLNLPIHISDATRTTIRQFLDHIWKKAINGPTCKGHALPIHTTNYVNRSFHKLVIFPLMPTLAFPLFILPHMVLVKVKLDVNGYKRIAFQCCRHSLFLIAQLKRRLQN